MAIHWLGIITSLFLLAHATFWLVQATASVLIRMPKQFNVSNLSHPIHNHQLPPPLTRHHLRSPEKEKRGLSTAPLQIGMWSFTFPWACYANAWSNLSRDLRNDGMRGWAATNTVGVLIIWLFCALMTAYLGFWKGELFSAPGLEDWLHKERGSEEGGDQGAGKQHRYDGTYTMPQPGTGDEEDGRKEGDGEANGQSSSRDQNESANQRQNGNSSELLSMHHRDG